MRRSGAVLVVLFVFVLSAARPAIAQVDAREIVQRSVAANIANWKASPEYEYTETDRENAGTKTYRVMMIDGSPYNRLVAVNGKPLAAGAAAHEQKKLEEAIAKRRSESSSERAQRIAKYQKDLHRNERFIREITSAFQMHLLRQEQLNGRGVYVLEATPRPGYSAPTNEAKVLKGMRGTLWIDKLTYQWVKVEAAVTRPVSIEGFLARVEPGTRFELENMPVDGQLWLPKHFAMKSDARILGVFDKRSQQDETYSDYRKVGEQASGAQPDNGVAHR